MYLTILISTFLFSNILFKFNSFNNNKEALIIFFYKNDAVFFTNIFALIIILYRYHLEKYASKIILNYTFLLSLSGTKIQATRHICVCILPFAFAFCHLRDEIASDAVSIKNFG